MEACCAITAAEDLVGDQIVPGGGRWGAPHGLLDTWLQMQVSQSERMQRNTKKILVISYIISEIVGD
ncbi:unnamed protein product [Pieris brassicae]|uniref:Uncharacterized protein n=1 Tax=Pieris brassicae TaxID=7116 RepID=A0A9P0U3N8_PIEBR|nr:unnamed protein product [Pieris brassicae]